MKTPPPIPLPQGEVEKRSARSAPLPLREGSTPPAIVLENVEKWFGALHVLRGVSFGIAERERIVICGPSGSGNRH